MFESASDLPSAIAQPGWLPLAAAFVGGAGVFLATGSALLGAVVPALAAGRRLFFTGARILRTDPQRARARICFAFYLAAAAFQSAGSALASIVTSCFIASRAGNEPAIEDLNAALFTLVASVVLTSLVGFGASCAAARRRVRVWVHPALPTEFDLLRDLATRLGCAKAGFNHAVFVIATSLALPILALGSVWLAHSGPANATIETDAVTARVTAAIGIGGIVGLIALYAWLSSRIMARHPGECWNIATMRKMTRRSQ